MGSTFLFSRWRRISVVENPSPEPAGNPGRNRPGMSEDQAYLLVKLELEGKFGDKQHQNSVDLSEDYLLHNVTHGLTRLFGQSGSAAPVEIHQVQRSQVKHKSAVTDLVITCPTHFVKKLRASLTLQGSYQGQPCVYTVLEVSSDPNSLSKVSSSSSSQQRYF